MTGIPHLVIQAAKVAVHAIATHRHRGEEDTAEDQAIYQNRANGLTGGSWKWPV
jgi:hypothetical protein